MSAMKPNFRTKLIWLFVAVLSITLLATTVAVLRATDRSVEALVRNELDVVQRVFLAVLEQERQQLASRAELLAGDFAFKQGIATGDQNTIVSVLANHGERISADLVVMLSRSGDVLLSTHDLNPLAVALKQAVTGDSRSSIEITLVAAEKPFQLVLVPVWAPDLIGWVGLGQEIDETLLDELRDITNADISLVYAASNADSEVRQISTLPQGIRIKSGRALEAVVQRGIEQLGDYDWLSSRVEVTNAEFGAAVAVLSLSLNTAKANYTGLRSQMVVIGLIALLVAALAAMLVSRWVTRPIYRLLDSAIYIATGDYSKPVQPESDVEFDRLATALNMMQETVAEREARIRHQAQHDMLTQLPNRHYMYTMVTDRIMHSGPGVKFGVGLLELRNLAQVTDLYGSEFADRVLQQTVDRLISTLRRGDIAARVADNQFLLFFADLDHAGIDPVIKKLDALVKDPITLRGVPVWIELATGFVFCPAHASEFDDILRRAQIALGHAREGKRNFAVYQIGQDENHLRQINIANRLQIAVSQRSFKVFYQPKYNLRTRTVDQVEALIRWHDEQLGDVYPDEFIPLAEQTGIITAISDLVLDAVIAQLKTWREQGIEVIGSVNLSGIDILQESFVRRAIARIESSGLPPDQLVMEITETAMMGDLAMAGRNMALFELAGIGLSIDDFGTGFSSLAQLKTLPVKELKIDKSLILHLDTENDDQLIVRSTIEMAHYLGLKVVAEGVENACSVELLHQMGCDALQGYYMARPMASEQFADWYRSPPEQVQLIPELLDETV